MEICSDASIHCAKDNLLKLNFFYGRSAVNDEMYFRILYHNKFYLYNCSEN